MANTGFKGIDVRQTGNQLVFRAFLQTSAGGLLGTGTTVVSITELQSDGTIKSYDFNDNTFKTTALTTPTLAMTHRPSNNAGTTTGLWTAALATLTGFTAGGIYHAIVNNSTASPTDQCREFQYGGDQGDLLVTAGSTGQAYLQGDTIKFGGTAQTTGKDVAALADSISSATTAAAIRADLGLGSANLDTQLALRTGYKLASDGLDSISTTAPAGVASNFREMVVQTWRRWFKKSTLTSTQLKTYADNGTSVLTTQTVSDDLTTQTQGNAS